MVVGNKFDLVVDSPNYTQVLRRDYSTEKKYIELNVQIKIN
jgi:hypothetical protein